jgi:hypothetical protein
MITAGSGIWYFYGGTGESSLPITPIGQTSEIEQRFLDLSGQLAQLSFDMSVFSDPRLLSLVSLSIPITPEAEGRPDPFAPIGR